MDAAHGEERYRFIPTSVGNTILRKTQQRVYTVHPHIRGEYEQGWISVMLATGSSPHPWGILLGLAVALERPRFIPTSVGNTDIE